LLIGTVPFDAGRLHQAGLAEMLRIIREEEAPSLPRRLTETGDRAADIAARRQTDAASLRRIVDGDLDSIAMKALQKARERRYSSVGEFAADIQRYLEHRPVQASPPSRLYRARKFLRRRRFAVLGIAAGFAFLLLSGLTVWSLLHRDSRPAPTVSDKRTIVLSDLASTTGDPAFDGAVRQAMAAELQNSPQLNVLSDTRKAETLRLMLRPSDTKFASEVAAEACERTGSSAVVEGSIARLGDQYLTELRAKNCTTGDVLDDEQTPATRKADVLNVLTQMAHRFGAQAGQLLPPTEKQPSFSGDVTTASLEAWRSYNAGMKAVQGRGSPVEAISLLKRATEVDPEFAMAYALLGRTYDTQGEIELGAQIMAKAYALRERVSDRENYFITFNYYRQVPRNLELARQAAESWAQKYPGDYMPHSFLGAFTAPGMGHYEQAVEESQKTIEMNPNMSIAYRNACFGYLYMNQTSEAEVLLRKAAERKIAGPEFSMCRYYIAFLKKDSAAMEREAAERKTKLAAQGWFEHQEALTLAYQGRPKEANRLSDNAVRLARQGDVRERVALFEGARAVWNALFANREEARSHASRALSLSRGRDTDYGPALALSLLNDSAPARKIELELEKRYPEDTCVQFSYLPALRGIEALNRGDAATAVEMTQAAAPYELAVPGTAFHDAAFFGALYPVYVRGLAYSRLGRHQAAAAEFQKIVDHPGIMLNDPIGPMARLQLARAWAASGDRSKSAAAYRDLLSLWKDADPDLPVVQEAKAEFAKQQ
jgi:eukaryotic-like serine/threonine-protein kinase